MCQLSQYLDKMEPDNMEPKNKLRIIPLLWTHKSSKYTIIYLSEVKGPYRIYLNSFDLLAANDSRYTTASFYLR